MKIFLIGLPGSGKSTLGLQLADKMKIDFIDLDLEIEKQQGQKITEIFEQKGEPHFRKLENSALANLIKSSQSFVMATGGGTPCFHTNMELMDKSGVTVFLDVTPQIVASRILKTDLSLRPMFKDLSEIQISKRIHKLREERIEFYNKAQIVLSGDNISVKDLSSAIS